jgi:hypothetical protein
MKLNFYAFTSLFLMTSSYTMAESNYLPVFEIKSDDTYIQAPLEKEIYYFSRSAYLSDIQIRDAHGNNLPFRIVDASTQSQSSESEVQANFFPVAPGTSEEKLRNLGATRIKIDADNMHLDIESNQPAAPAPVSQPDFYLINLRDAVRQSKDMHIKEIILEWNYQEANQFQEWEVSASQDLHYWNKLTSTNLVWLEKEGQSLIQNKIQLNLNPDQYQYLQLRCLEFCDKLRIENIKLVTRSTAYFIPADTQWSLQGQKSSSQKAINLHHNDDWESRSAWDFQRKENTDIKNFKLNMGDQSYGDKIRIMGKARQQDPWELLYEGLWFNTKVGNRWVSSNNSFSLRRGFPYLRLEFASELRSEFSPEFIFSVPSRYIQFIANQTPPYVLAVQDNANSEAQARIFNSVVNNQSISWANHQWHFLNPEYKENPATFAWKSLLFWCFLVIAVGLLAWMAVKLFKQMNAQQN